MRKSGEIFSGKGSTVPPLSASLQIEPCSPAQPIVSAEAAPKLEPIAGLTCVIEYDQRHRLISCRRFKRLGDYAYVGAVCLEAGGYREFRTDRISLVFDPPTGEILGDGHYFGRFALDEFREGRPTWGLTPSRQVTLIAGLNVLAFMAQCDGHWHQLETEPVERFICTLWLRREWEGDPPLEDIVAHARRLSPDSDTFFQSVENYARSEARSSILRTAVANLIAADGVICDEEHDWGQQFSDYLAERTRASGVA